MTDWSQHFESAAQTFENTTLVQFVTSNDFLMTAILLVVLVVFYHAFPATRARKSKRGFRRLVKKPWTRSGPTGMPFQQSTPNLTDPRQQIDAISKVGFERTRLLNKEESRLLPLLESVASDADRGFRVMAQTSLGEVLRPKPGSADKQALSAAYASINSKRLDFAIFDRSGLMCCAIEYQGSGHYQNNAFMRDAVKKEALRRAGVPLIEVMNNFDPDDIRKTVERLLTPDRSRSQHGHTAVHM